MGEQATEHDFYASPAVYDILHTPGTAGEVDCLVRLARRFVSGRGGPLVFLEPACGSGRYLRGLASRGHRAIGFDREPAMVEYAARRLARFGRLARVFRAEMESIGEIGGRGGVAAGCVDVAFTPINSIRHLPSDRAMLAHFEQISRVLRPRGVYAVGLSIAAYGAEQPSEDVWEGARGSCRVQQVVQYLPAEGGRGGRDERVISHLAVTTPRGTRHLDSAYSLRSYDLGQWYGLIARSSLEIAGVVDEGGEDHRLSPPGYAIFVLRRRAARQL